MAGWIYIKEGNCLDHSQFDVNNFRYWTPLRPVRTLRPLHGPHSCG